MSGMPGTPYARRCLVPQALKSVFVGAIPAEMEHDLKLPPDTRFETLVPACVDVRDYYEDLRLLNHLSAVARPALRSRWFDLTASAFPAGLAGSINFAGLPLRTRTRNRLEEEKLLTSEVLQRRSLGDLLAIRGFGVKELMDLLTAVEAVNEATAGEATPVEPTPAVPAPECALLLRLAHEGPPVMPWRQGKPHAWRCLMPRALKAFFKGKVPVRLGRDLGLPRGTPFEALVGALVEVPDDNDDRRLLDHLTHLIGPVLASPRQDLTTRAFPAGLASSINFARLPLHTRTRNCLEKEELLTAEMLQRKSLRDLLDIRSFRVKSLVDLLTAVEAVNSVTDADAILGEAVNSAPDADAILVEPSPVVPVPESALLLRLAHEGPPVMAFSHGEPHARRCLIPRALKAFFKGKVSARLRRDLGLPRGTPFETLVGALVEAPDHTADRRLLDHLTDLVGPALISLRQDLTTRAFPAGVSASINFARLPLHTRTWNCLEKEGLLTAEVLQQQSLGDLLSIRAFGVKCLVDLLTAVEVANWGAEEVSAPAAAIPVLPELHVVPLLSRLTSEARLLRDEPWAKEVSLYDIRLGTRLLRDAEWLKGVRQALAEGRLTLEERVCPEPPRRDLDLLRCPLMTHTKNCLCAAKLTTLSTVASLTLRDVCEIDGFGERSRADLLAMLDVCRYLTWSANPENLEPTLADFCEAVVNRTRNPWFPERMADRMHQTRALSIRCLSLSLEEELRDIAASSSLSRPDVVIEHLGWDGRDPRSLKAAGNARRLSRERVRQLVACLRDRLSESSAWAPILRRALDTCGRACPRPAKQIAAMLQQQELATTPFHPHGLLTAAKILRVTHSFSLRRFGVTDWLFQGEDEALLQKSLELVGSVIAARAVCSMNDLQAELREQTGQNVAEDTLREWIGGTSGFHWVDGDQQWFRGTTEDGSRGRRRIGSRTFETILWKILAVAPEIQLGELREGLTRHPRFSSVPPSDVLRQLCRQLGLQVDGDIVRVQQPLRPEDVLSEVEFTFFDILRVEGPLLPTRGLEKRCLQRGMNRHTFSVYLGNSPILARYAPGVYGLRGAQVASGEAEGLRPRLIRSRAVLDFGWKQGGAAWIAYTVTDGMLRSGIVVMPPGVRDTLGDGAWPLFAVDRTRVGTLVFRGGAAWGLAPFFRRHRGADVGDVLVLEIDRKTEVATVRVGGPELLEQIRRDLRVSSDLGG